MKKLTVEYQGYKLELEITPIKPGNLLIPYIKGTCEIISFFKDGHFKNEDYSAILESFMSKVDQIIELEEKRQFIYKDFTLKLGWIEDPTKQTMRKGGYCKELDYKTYGEDDEHTITKFKKYVNWRISEDRKKEIEELKQKEAREIPDLLKSIDNKLDQMREDFKKSGLAFNILGSKKESSSLSLTYKGYRMEIVNTINYEKRLYFTGKCEIMNFDKSSISITSLIEDFEKTVDSVLFMNK